MSIVFSFQKVKPAFWVVVLLGLAPGVVGYFSCQQRTKRVDQVTEQQKDTKVDQHQKNDQRTETQEQKQRHADGEHDISVKRHTTRTKTTTKQPDGTVTTQEQVTTDYEKADQQTTHEQETASTSTEKTETSTTETTTHVEEHEQTRTETHIVETTGFGSRVSLGVYVTQDIRAALAGKLDVVGGVSAGLRLIGPARVNLGIDWRGNAWVGGSVGALGLYASQNVNDLRNGFHPVPGVSVDFALPLHLNVGAGIDLHANSFIGLGVRL